MTASLTVLAALRASGLPLEAQAFLATIAEGEGGVEFNTLYSGGSLVNQADATSISTVNGLREWIGLLAQFPAWSGATTAGGLISTAAGAWQDTRTTWNAYAASFGVTDFTPPSQISFNWQLAQKVFGTRMGANLLQVLEAGETAMVPAYLASTWPGGANASFANRYTANLAALGVPPPQEYVLNIPAGSSIMLQGTDAQGNAASVLLKALAVSGLVLLSAASSAPFGTSVFSHQAAPFAPPSVGGLIAGSVR